MPDPDFGSADYELRWPRDLFARELAALRRTRPSAQQVSTEDERIVFLLDEAFLGQTPSDDYRQATKSRRAFGDPWGSEPDPFAVHELDGDGYLDALLSRLPELREHHEPRPYWPDRRRARRALDTPDDDRSVWRRFTRLIEEQRDRGLFGRELPPECIDADDVDEADVLEARLGIPGLWPLQPENWDEDTFYGLIEVFHDLAVRPRERSFHSYNGCGWHYSAFNTDTGRALYRWRINRLLERAGVGLSLAGSGADVGRLVEVTDEARGDLVERALASADPRAADEVRHAISLFRRRDATTHDKRSAVVALHRVLEGRKRLLKSALFTADEDALAHIANKFDLRHADDKQHTNYDPAFRDWVFWWYLATIELTDRLLARQAAAADEAEETA
ncbi:MAG: hypothetical protein AB7N73_12145 [Gemmatimonadales bacterium]